MTRLAPSKSTTLTAALAVLLAGCAAGPADRLRQCRSDLDNLRQENRQLQKQIIERNKTIAEQLQRIETLQALGSKRLEQLVTVDHIQLQRLTGGYSSTGGVAHDGIVIYLQPIDADGHVIKAAGTARVELFDLANPDGRQMIGRWDFTAKQLRQLWAGRLWTHHYTLRCKFPTRPAHDQITVRVQFTELLTGKTFTAQKLCKVNMPPE